MEKGKGRERGEGEEGEGEREAAGEKMRGLGGKARAPRI